MIIRLNGSRITKNEGIIVRSTIKDKNLEKDIEHLKESKDICEKSNKSFMSIIINITIIQKYTKL